jgi:MEMO1 family protein
MYAKQTIKMLFLVGCMSGILAQEHKVQKPFFAGSWYPKSKLELNQFFARVENSNTPKLDVRACIVPHAGYEYSGAIASNVYNHIDPKNVKRIVVLAPSHRRSYVGVALPLFQHYTTPLGNIEVDTKAVQQLANNAIFTQQHAGFTQEHSCELQLPFIKHHFPDATILPLIISQVTTAQIYTIAEQLAPLIEDHTLIVVSSDFVHYGPRYGYLPFTNNIRNNLDILNGQALRSIIQFHLPDFESILQTTQATVCGSSAIRVLLNLIAKNKLDPLSARLVSYGHSTPANQTIENDVSYAGLIFVAQTLKPSKKQAHDIMQFVRSIIQEQLNNTYRSIKPTELDHPFFQQNLGVFVTLNKNKQLRGCRGYTLSNRPLGTTLKEAALLAAFGDDRFEPLQPSEWQNIELEVTLLERPHSVTSYTEIEVGTHGLLIELGNKNAVFLPQVATQQRWSLEQMLQHLCIKAGLKPNSWKNPAMKFSVFRGHVIR